MSVSPITGGNPETVVPCKRPRSPTPQSEDKCERHVIDRRLQIGLGNGRPVISRRSRKEGQRLAIERRPHKRIRLSEVCGTSLDYSFIF